MTTVLVDTHVLQWWSAEPARLSGPATAALEAADELSVAAVTWYELAWLAERGRIRVRVPIGTWLGALARSVRTAALTPAVAAIAVALPRSFPRDPADRLIYATAIENGWQLITKDGRIRCHQGPASAPTIW